MKQVCAWCFKDLGGTREDPNEPISHGICQECMEKEIAKLDGENVPAVAVGETG